VSLTRSSMLHFKSTQVWLSAQWSKTPGQ
jgi:hypothetical protein